MTNTPNIRTLTPIIALIFSAVTSSCITEIPFEIEEEESQYVIYGEITDRSGPYNVEVYKTVPFNNSIGNIATTAVNSAIVTISDLAGRSEQLNPVSPGKYRTSPNGIAGMLNQSYFLTVEIGENIYQSSIQTIKPVPEIDTVYYELTYRKSFVGETINEVPYVDFYVELVDKQEEQNYYLWKWEGVAQVKTFPELYSTVQNGMRIISPLPCSVPFCECCDCWIDKGTKNPLVPLSDQYVNGNLINSQIFSLPVNANYFDSKLYVNVLQHSINQDVYAFWKLIADQEESESTLFAVPSAQIESNIKNINNENELVWGIFSASSVVEKSIFIDRNELGIRVPSDSIKDDCSKIPGSTNQKPSFWID